MAKDGKLNVHAKYDLVALYLRSLGAVGSLEDVLFMPREDDDCFDGKALMLSLSTMGAVGLLDGVDEAFTVLVIVGIAPRSIDLYDNVSTVGFLVAQKLNCTMFYLSPSESKHHYRIAARVTRKYVVYVRTPVTYSQLTQ